MKNAKRITFALLMGATTLTPLSAATQYLYSGHDTTFPTVQYRLTITETGAGFKVAGSVYDGRGSSLIDGAGAGSGFAATASYNNGYQNVTIAIYGALNGGAMGIGTIGVYSPSQILFNGQFVPIYATLSPVPPSTSTTPPPTTIVLPASVHMSGGTGFGYTTVTITLDNTLKGSFYEVSGMVVVKTEMIKSSGNTIEETTLGVSGVLTPGVTGDLALSGVPSGNKPSYTATIAADGTSFTSFLSGLPTLSITGLYLDASQ